MSLRKLINRVTNAAGDAVGAAQDFGGGLRDLAQPALDLINDNAPAGLTDTLATGARYAGHTALLANPLTQLPYATYRAFQAGRSLFEGEPLRALGVAAGPTADAAQIGHGLVEEPALYGVNRALGTDTVDVKDDQGNVIGSRPSGGPFSGRNRAAIGQAAGEIDNPLLRGGARAGLAGLDIATNPATYAPTGELPLIAQLGAGAVGIGGFGGNGPLSKAARALIMGGAGEAASEGIGTVTDNPLAKMGAGLVGMAAAHQIGSRLPLVTNPLSARLLAAEAPAVNRIGKAVAGAGTVFAESPVPAGRIRNPFTDPFKSPAELRGTNELGIMDDRIRAMVTSGQTPPDQLVSARNDTYRRMYHGTTTPFDAPDPGLFDQNGLFGPGYYLTSEPRVAEGYANTINPDLKRRFDGATQELQDWQETIASLESGPMSRSEHTTPADRERMLTNARKALPEAQRRYDELASRLPSPNIRPVNVPENLNMFDIDKPVSKDLYDRIYRQLGGESDFPHTADAFDEYSGGPGESGQAIYRALERISSGDKSEVNDTLAALGFDGITHQGGLLMPLKDAAGNPIRHDVAIIFPESLPKLRNTLSGTAMGVVGEGTGQAAGAAEPGSFAASLSQPGAAQVETPMSAALDGTVSLHAGLPLPIRTVAGGAIGAGIGALAPADSNDERRQHALMGAGIGATGAQFGPAILKKIAAGATTAKGAFAPGSPEYIQTYDKAVTGEARLVARNERVALTDAAKTWDQQVKAGGVTETPARTAYVNHLLASAVSPEAAQQIQDNRLSMAVVREDPTGFNITTPEAQHALAQADNAYLRQESGDVAAGVLDPAALQSDYQNRVWKQPPPVTTGSVPRRPGAAQAFQKGRTFDNFLEGMARGYEPASMDVPSLLEHRVQAGYTARAQKTLLDTIKSDPTAISATPQAGYVELSRLLPRGATPTYVREDVAQALDNYFTPESKGFQTLGKITEVPREAVLGADLAMPGRVGASAFVQTAFSTLNPLKLPENITRATVAGVKSFRDSTVGREAFLQDPTTQAWSRHMVGLGPGDTGEILGRTEGGTLLQKIPLLGPTGKALEDWQFGSYIPALKVNTAEQIFKSRGGYRLGTAAQEVLREEIGRRVDTVLSGISRARAGTTRNQEEVLRTFLLSPAWVRGVAANLTDVAKGGPQGDMARAFWGGFAMTSVAAAAGLTAAFQGDLSINNLENLVDPRSENSVTNPRSKFFLKVTDGAGNRHDLWGPLVPIIRSIARIPAGGIGDTAESLDAGKPLDAAVKDGLGAAFGMDNTQAVRDWSESRQSIPLGLARDLASNQDFRGRVITNAADPNQRVIDKALYAGSSLLPGVAQSFLSNENTATPQLGINDRSLKRGAAGFFGENFTPGPNDPKPYQDKVSNFLESQGLHGGVDPISTLKSAVGKGTVAMDAYQRFRLDNPDVTDYLKQKDQLARDNREKPVGQGAAQEYTDRRKQYADVRDAEIKAAAPLLAQGDGKGYRAAVRDAWTKYTGALENEAQVMWGTGDLKTAQQFIDKAYGGSDPSSLPINQAFDQYEGIQAKDDTPEQRDAMLEARRAYLAAGGAADQQFGAGTSTKLRTLLRDRYQETGGPEYANYFDAQQVMGEYASLPAYRTMDAPAARRAQTLVQQAQDAVKYGYVPKAEIALFANTSADPTDRLNALRILKSGSKLANPERRWFLRDPQVARQVSKFYGSVIPELYQQVAQGA